METAAQQTFTGGGVGDAADPAAAVSGPDVGAGETPGGSVRREPGPIPGGQGSPPSPTARQSRGCKHHQDSIYSCSIV